MNKGDFANMLSKLLKGVTDETTATAWINQQLAALGISCDESYYSLTFEPDDEPLF